MNTPTPNQPVPPQPEPQSELAMAKINALQAVVAFLEGAEAAATKDARAFEWSPADEVQKAIEELLLLRAESARLHAILSDPASLRNHVAKYLPGFDLISSEYYGRLVASQKELARLTGELAETVVHLKAGYEIQSNYETKTESLRQQLAAVTKERDEACNEAIDDDSSRAAFEAQNIGLKARLTQSERELEGFRTVLRSLDEPATDGLDLPIPEHIQLNNGLTRLVNRLDRLSKLARLFSLTERESQFYKSLNIDTADQETANALAQRENLEREVIKLEEQLATAQQAQRDTSARAGMAEELAGALREIEEGKGPFSRDPLTHACNTIDAIKQLATDALARYAALPKGSL